MFLELKSVFNDQNPPASLTAELTFTVGAITLNTLAEIRAFADELSTPLTAHLVLFLPFQFTASDPIPVFAGPDPALSPSPNPAIKLIDSGDLLGRDGGDEFMDDIGRSLKSLTLEASVANKLGIGGYVKMLQAMPSSYDPSAEGLGIISLSGESSITIPGTVLNTDPFVPFSPALEVYLEGDFDIKRNPSQEDAVTMNLGIILHTSLTKTF
jgi:hypothetical protein